MFLVLFAERSDMPKAQHKTCPHCAATRGPSARTSPRSSVRASSAATQSLVESSVPAQQSSDDSPLSTVSASPVQPSSAESALPPHLFETLVAKVANEVSRSLAAVPLASSAPAPSQLNELAVCSTPAILASGVQAPSTVPATSSVTTFAAVPAPVSSSLHVENLTSSVVQHSMAMSASAFTNFSLQTVTEIPGQLFQSAGLSR